MCLDPDFLVREQSQQWPVNAMADLVCAFEMFLPIAQCFGIVCC